MSRRITRQLALDSLQMALTQRGQPQQLLHHSDRGSQYASKDYQRLLQNHGIECSMSRRGNCWECSGGKLLRHLKDGAEPSDRLSQP